MEQPPEFQKEQTEPIIEIVQPGEWEAFKMLWLKGLQSDPTAFAMSYEQEAARSDEAWQRELVDSARKIYAAKIGEQMAATAMVRFEKGDNVKHLAKLGAVFTNPEFRGRGIATKLLEKILADLHEDPKIVKVRLSVNEVQEVARKLYEKLGFVEAGVARKEMKIGDTYFDSVQMEKLFEDKL